MKRKLRVAVIAGGLSSEREVSLKSGVTVFRALATFKNLEVRYIDLTPDRKFIAASPKLLQNQKIKAKATTSAELISAAQNEKVDVAFLALHGKYGEDGTIQGMLELAGIPYTGSNVLASALAMDKVRTSKLAEAAGIRVPKSLVVLRDDVANTKILSQIKKTVGYPCAVKPNQSGSSIGVSKVTTDKELKAALKQAAAEDGQIIIQQWITGRELTCGVIGNSGQGDLQALPIVEIVTPGTTFFDYHQKYQSTEVKELCPAPITKKRARDIQQLATKVHHLIGCDGMSRSDFIMTKDNKIYFLEINTIPGLTDRSLLPQQAKAAGISVEQLMMMQVELALKRHQKKTS